MKGRAQTLDKALDGCWDRHAERASRHVLVSGQGPLVIASWQDKGCWSSRLVEGEFDDEVGKLYLNDRQTPIPWRDPHAPTGRVVAVLAPAEAEVGGSFRTSARESAKVAALLPGRIADIGHEERTRAACLALSAALLSAVPLAMAGWHWWS